MGLKRNFGNPPRALRADPPNPTLSSRLGWREGLLRVVGAVYLLTRGLS
jgi:hypothetical protein